MTTERERTILPPPPEEEVEPVEVPHWQDDDRFTKSDVAATWRPVALLHE